MSALARIGPLTTACAFVLALAVAAFAAPGDLDPTFGTNGRVDVSPALESVATAAAVQPDGKIVLAGWADEVVPPPPPPSLPERLVGSNADFLTVRLGPHGSLDPSFGSGGVVRTPLDLGNSNRDHAWAAAVGPGGKIVLAGSALGVGGSYVIALVRYTPSGALDSTFSGDGIKTVDLGFPNIATGVAVQPDGKIVVIGRGGDGFGFMVVRLLANGELDGSFGSGGVVSTNVGAPETPDEAHAVLLVGGKIVVAGVADAAAPLHTTFAVVRYLSNGRLDPSFSGDGIVVGRPSYEQRAWALAAAPDGKLVVGGDAGGDFRVARFLASGAPDATFGDRGAVTTSFERRYARAWGVAVQGDGKVVAGGLAQAAVPENDQFAVARYKVDGTPDNSFGISGKQTYDVAPRVSGGASVLQPGALPAGAGRYVVAGFASAGGGMPDHIVALGVDLGPLGFPPPARCLVPRVVGLRLAVARARIHRANCSVGRVRRVRARKRRGGIVVAQSPRPGRRLERGARVNLVVGRR
jgi:uncharacterized delta-60 repeat protein